MMHTPEEKALIEAVGALVLKNQRLGNAPDPLSRAYDAYMASLTTPPSCLAPAPKGKRRVRVEYPNGWPDAQDGECLVYPSGGLARRGYAVFDSSNDYTKGLAQVLRHGWRLVDDPEADSLERLLEDWEDSTQTDIILICRRIRALIGDGK